MASTTEDAARVLDPTFFQDPYAIYAELRAEGPARKVLLPGGWETWIVTRYDEARATLADPRLHKNGRVLEQYMDPGQVQADDNAFAEALRAHMLSSDPPDHTRLRKLVNKAFTARRVEALRPRIEAITGELLDAMAATASATASAPAAEQPIDLIEAFAFPLPMTVICELLGVPYEDREDFHAWSSVVVGDDVTDAQLRSATHEMAAYLGRLLASKRANPADDLLTALTQASDNEDRLDGQELISMTFLLLVAGHETTVNLIGNGTLALLRDPGQLARLRAEPSLTAGAVEEFLRYNGPINLATMRYTTQVVQIGDVAIPAGEFVLVSLASANHDAARFSDPDQLDITRSPGGHLAFGHGIHFCLGAPLARVEAEIAFRELLARFPALRLGDESASLRWRNSSLIRGLERLPVYVS